VPSQKRARKRAARQARIEAVERQKRRRSTVRRTIVIVVLVAVAAGIYVLVRPSGKAAKSASKTTTTTTTTTPVATSVPDSSTTTTSVANETTSANCPKTFTATTKLNKPSWSSPPPMIIDPSKQYTATVTTSAGVFTIGLDAKAAPTTVNNFVFLAENHFYDCVVFHRVITGFMDQTGDPTGSGSGGPGYEFANENTQSSYLAGQVAMANSGGTDTDGSQFFVLVDPYTPPSGDSYSLFGAVTSGGSVVDAINGQGSSSGTPKKLFRIISITISSS
jgi:cyclophilin family peptidyl-prolyl cis-trans isomerase